MQQHGSVLAYLSHTDFPSHMYSSGFYFRDLYFDSVEKFIMFSKAKLFHDEGSAQLILNAENGYQCKELGKNVVGFNQAVWDEWSPKVALVGNREKYKQNPGLAQLLVQTSPLILAEGSWNKRWGAGYAKDDPRIGNVAQWPGQNLGGNTVMVVRTELMNGTLR
jgi:ribA/ribD-fused uncharacterized protein